MTEEFIDRLFAKYDVYVDTFRVDGKLPDLMQLKRIHTDKVVANARAIAAGEGFDDETAAVEAVHLIQGGRVLALQVGVRDAAHLGVEPRIQGLDDAGLAHAGLAGEKVDPVPAALPQGVDPFARAGGSLQDGVAGALR